LGLRARLAERDELVAQVDPRHPSPVPAELELQELPPPLERLIDAIHLEGDVIDTQGAHPRRLVGITISHGTQDRQGRRLRSPARCWRSAGTGSWGRSAP